MGLFSDDNDDDVSFQDENIAPPVKRSAGNRKKAGVMDDDDDGDASFDDSVGNDDSDFEVTSKKSKSSNGKANPASKAKASTTAKSRKKPLKSVENEMSLEGNDDGSTPAPSTNASSQYQKLSQLEHVLKRPDTYIGSVEKTETKMWIFDKESNQMVLKDVTIVPGFYKIFDEILVNAADNKIRDSNMDTLNVDIDTESNTISIYNNGRGIPVEVHEKEKLYIPELIFGNLLTSSNYDDDQKKVTGGRNGYGAKVSVEHEVKANQRIYTNY